MRRLHTPHTVVAVLLLFLAFSKGLSAQALTKAPSLGGEKVFLHTDRDFYLAGEIAWYSLYLVEDQNHTPSTVSKVAYVELLKGKNPVLQQSIPLKKGLGAGSFYLPVALASGNYTLRAYTRWMRNEGPEGFFEKEISLINTLQAGAIPPVPNTAYTVQLFPEGGKLVNGLESQVAVHITDQQGKGVDFSGALVQGTDTLSRFDSQRFGMGKFSVKPDTGKLPRLFLSLADTTLHISLPEAETQGLVMQLTESGDQLRLKLKCQPPGLIPNVKLWVHTRRQLQKTEVLELVSGTAEIVLDRSILGAGVSCLTVMDTRKNALCERLYFKPPAKGLELQANPSLNRLQTRQELEVQIEGAKTEASLSVAVYKLDSLQPLPEENIRSYFWLSSDIKGRIESPGFYMLPGAEAQQQADLLMLTQGWRTFQWDRILQNPAPEPNYAPEYEGALISGTVKGVDYDEIPAHATAMLSIPGPHFKLYHSAIAKNGDLLFATKGIYGPVPLVLSTTGIPDSALSFALHSPYASEFTSVRNSPLYLPPTAGALLQERSMSMQLENIFTGEQRNRFHTPWQDTLAFYGTADQTYRLDDYTRFPTMMEVMTEYVPEVAIRKKDDHYTMAVFQNREKGFYNSAPLILVNGLPLSSDKLLSLNPFKIRKMDIIQDKFVFGKTRFPGVVSYTTYDDSDWWQKDEDWWKTEYQGLAEQRVFHSTHHTEGAENRVPDFRSLLFWGPAVKLQAGTAKTAFYTSDLTGRFIGIVQGMGKEGKMGYTTFEFEVEEKYSTEPGQK